MEGSLLCFKSSALAAVIAAAQAIPAEGDFAEDLRIARGKSRRLGRFLNDLRVAVRSLRRKIEQDPSTPRLIINEPGVGYRVAVS